MRLSLGLKSKSEQLEKLERTRELEVCAVRDKLAEIEGGRVEMAAVRREQ